MASSAQLLQEAIALNTETPILSIVETALREYVAHRKRLQVIELFGTLDYEDDYDYKQHAKKSYPAYEP
ncbi:MAG: type II toxin-antitoxin system VapB family antitoxin [Synechococcales cyanobacterium RM1_1_8]|nr:type II toxin-antitoxin system VapB family antitoxin [Synechococcales cyanobacterium RM1_1_8]